MRTTERNIALRPRLVAALLAAILGALAVVAQAQPQADPPVLRLEDPFASTLWRVDVDGSGRHIVSSTADNALTLWSLDDPERARILRLPLREEERQRARAIAISPDGETIAYGVPPLRDAAGLPRPGTARIYIVKRNSGAIAHVIEDVATRPQALRFSPDGTALAATLSDGCGLRVWAAADWSEIAADDAGYGGGEANALSCCIGPDVRDCDKLPDTPGLLFLDPDITGLWLVTSGDTGLRGYQRAETGIVPALYRTPEDIGLARPEGLALSPDGARLAVGDRRIRGTGAAIELKVAVLEAATLRPARPPLAVGADALLHAGFLDPAEVPGADQMALHRVAWIRDEASGEDFVYAGGTLWCQVVEPDLLLRQPDNALLDICAVRWRPDAVPEERPRFVPVGIDRVMDLVAVPARKALVYATLRRIGALEPDGDLYDTGDGAEFLRTSRAADFRDRLTDTDGTGLAFAISDDAQRIYFEDYRSTERAPIRLVFSVDRLALETVDRMPEGLTSPDLDPVLLAPRSQWWNRRALPEIYGMALQQADDPNDITRSLALAGRRALIGSANFLRLIDYSGEAPRLLCRRRISAEAFRVHITQDGSLAVVGHSDGTLRWYRIADAQGPASCSFEHLLSVHLSETEWGSGKWTWTAWLPDTGRFASDALAKPLLTWQVTDEDGRIATVRHARMLDLYDRKAVSAALTRAPLAESETGSDLRARVAHAVDPVYLVVEAPGELEAVDNQIVPFALDLQGEGDWPRRLTVELGTGIRVGKRVAGRFLTPDVPVTVEGPGPMRLDVVLPEAARRAHAGFHVCFRLDEARTCHTLNWAGPVVKPKSRRLWAVIVGFSAYDDAALNLRFAQNDALDLARLFAEDHRARAIEHTSKVAPDYDDIRIDLIVSPNTATARAELAELERLPFVHIRPPGIESIRAALERLAGEDRQEQLSNDLFIFYYSGHGLLHPYNAEHGRTALLGPGIDAAFTRESLEKSALTSDELLAALKEISAEKLVILDACRTTAGIPTEIPFDPGMVNKEFEEQVLSAHFLFSARAGQYSLEQKDLVFSEGRPEKDRGNGLFTYGLLRALTAPEADLASRIVGRNKIEVREIGVYLDRFFDPDDHESAATRLIDKLRGLGIAATAQQPTLVPARRVPSDVSVVRSLEPAPTGGSK